MNACDELKINHKNIIAITMPGFGTTSRTHDNASKMMRFYGVTKKEIDIIIHHMFPLTCYIPRSKEARLLCIADKICAWGETVDGKLELVGITIKV